MYLTTTRPDITHVVGLISKFMENWRRDFSILKRYYRLWIVGQKGRKYSAHLVFFFVFFIVIMLETWIIGRVLDAMCLC